MKEYESAEEAHHDPELDFMIVWECDACGARREDRPGFNEGGQCSCGGEWREAGESYLG